MSIQRQPLLAEDDVPLQDLHTPETSHHQALRQSEGYCNDEADSFFSASPSPQEVSTLSIGPPDPEMLPFTGDGSCSSANTYLLPKPLNRRTKPRPRIVFSTEFLLVLGSFASAIFGGLSLIFSTHAAGDAMLTTNCESVATTGIERGFLVDRFLIQDVSFTRAKLFDLAWDTFIGQGLRFFHAWLLYHVIARCLTATMETDTVPYGAYLDLHFTTVSFASIWSSFSFIFARKPVRAIRFALWLLFSIIYVLSFATVWSATTGYISGSVPTFNVSSITYTSTKSPELTVCWVLEDDRVTLNGTKRIIIGPPAGDAFGYNPSNLRNPLWSQGNLQPTRNQLPKEMNDFMDVYSYFLTKSLIIALLQSGNSSSKESALELTNFNKDFASNVSISPDGILFNTTQRPPSAISDIGAWQIERYDTSIGKTPRPGVNIGNSSEKYSLVNSTSLFATHARFMRNDSVISNSSHALPYNSTMMLGAKRTHLEAPFLSASTTCTQWIHSDLEQCICMNGIPVEDAIDAKSPTGCISDVGYTWGFLSGVLGVAVILEGFWISSTWIMWIWACQHGTLVSMWRSGSGTIRNILDAAEAITEHLGDQHSAYTEKQLSKQLKSSPPFGYLLEE